MKKYGIYLLNRPGVDLRAEGLGRHMASFLKAGRDSQLSHWVIACPSWMKSTLEKTLGDFDLSPSDFEILATNKEPFFVKIYVFLNGLMKGRSMSPSVKPIEGNIYSRVKSFISKQLRSNPVLISLYFWIENQEAARLNHLIEDRQDISAWYCPNLFTSGVTGLKRPVLICAPDLFMHDFPIGFAVHVPQALQQFRRMRETIENGKRFTTYSQSVKEDLLIKAYHKDPNNVYVIHHGANRLDQIIDKTNPQASFSLLNEALQTARGGYYANTDLQAGKFNFLFYASQARPNKNLFTLIKAFKALRSDFKSTHKLILTGNPDKIPALADFIHQQDLDNEILWLNLMPAKQLAACYHLADLSVNPTFSEGGLPFTFTESLSLDTPVLMSRIPVTEEIIRDPSLNEMMLFNPYDWKEMAEKINWALNHQQRLLESQLPLYNELAKRTWTDVVTDYVKVLDSIADKGEST